MPRRSLPLLPNLAASALLALLALATPGIVAAQDTTRADDASMCFGFAFGSWTPPLDWKAAGHGLGGPDTSRFVHAPAGRDWAAETPSLRDTVLMLYPAWWPVGVEIALPTRRLVTGDTVLGKAIALVGDGRVRPPEARVRAWRVRCGAPAPPPAAAPAPAAPDSVRRRPPPASSRRP